ncbi:MAG: hypothetical protein LQ339_007773 [Xanthoria mediterranea]|nr:MAG: hypothetical protein LQ339_007773 [Xanthoria mediterranea]
MIPRKPLERLCQEDRINQSRSDTVHDLLKAVPAHLFTHLSTQIFQHADQKGRDTILRALSHAATHLELHTLCCSVQDEHVLEIFEHLVHIDHEREKAEPFDLQRAQDALFSRYDSPISRGDCSTTPNPAEMRVAKWVSDQNTLRSEHDNPSEHRNNRKRRHSETASAEPNLSNVGVAFAEKELQERVATRQQPKRACKSINATQSAIRRRQREPRTRQMALQTAQLSPRGMSKPRAGSGNLRSCRTCSGKEPKVLKDNM